MTAFAEDPDTLRAEELAASYARAYLETDATFAEIVDHLEDIDRCPDPWQHDRDYSASETVQRMRVAGQLPQRVPGICPQCGKATWEPGGEDR